MSPSPTLPGNSRPVQMCQVQGNSTTTRTYNGKNKGNSRSRDHTIKELRKQHPLAGSTRKPHLHDKLKENGMAPPHQSGTRILRVEMVSSEKG